MRHILAGASLAALSLATLLPASAHQYRGAALPTRLALREASLQSVPNLSGVHTFTIITRSKQPADTATLVAYFKKYGFTVTVTPHRKNLLLRGTYAQAASAGHTSYTAAKTPTQRFARATTAISFPKNISALISGNSLSPGLRALPLSSRPNVAVYGPSQGYGPADIASIYDIGPVYSQGFNGAGVAVAIAACSTVNASDVVNYGQTYGLPAANITYIPIDGTTTEEDGEAVLDAERVYGTAPGAKIYEYLAPDCYDNELIDMFAQIAEDASTHKFSAVSHSYGLDEADYSYFGVPDDLTNESAAIAEIAAQNIPVFVASGDNGSWGDLTEFETDVSYPASDPGAIAVGATTVIENGSGTRAFEYAWGGSGGGVSGIFPIPYYQKGVAGVASTQFKNLPDVAMVGDPNTGVAEYWANNVYGAPPLFAIGGTSVAAPTFAGVFTLINQERAKYGLPYSEFAARGIYQYASTDFYDVTKGTNGFYATGKGYDNVTGVGAPDVAKLAKNI